MTHDALPLTILLVEDEEIVRAGMVALLELAGHVVVELDTGERVVEAIGQHHPDVVVLDLGLPGVAGSAVYRSIRERWHDLPVIFSTGTSDPKWQTGHGNHKVRTLVKPYDMETLLATIRDLRGN